MPNPNYTRGVRFEYARKRVWEGRGYLVLRTAGSHGAWDLVAIRHDAPVELIQCKVLKAGTTKQAEALVRAFKIKHPHVDSRYFHQTIEVYAMKDRLVSTGSI